MIKLIRKKKKFVRTMGKRFKEWRLENNWTQLELGKKLKLSNTYISQFELDRVGIGNETLQFLGLHFDIDLKWLITGVKSRKRK